MPVADISDREAWEIDARYVRRIAPEDAVWEDDDPVMCDRCGGRLSPEED